MNKLTMSVEETSNILGVSGDTIRKWTIQERISWAVLDSGKRNNIVVIVPRFWAWLTATDLGMEIERFDTLNELCEHVDRLSKEQQ